MKYYRSYHLTDNNIIERTEGVPFVLKVYHSAEIEANIGEELDSKGNINWVIYYTDTLTDEIKKHHINNYRDVQCSTGKKLRNGVMITFYNNDYEISSYLVETYYPDGRTKILQEFDSEFELVEYRQEIYNDALVLIEEKIFYADSWTIHREDIEE